MAQTINMSSSVRITEKGLTLIGKCISGREMHFTKVLLGEGDMPAGTTMDAMTAMVKPMMNLPIQGSYIDAPGVMVLEVALKNAGLATTFQSKEVGVFAQDPNEGEILYAYSYNPKAEFIPAAGGDQLWDMVYEYTTIVKDVPNITVNITDGSGNYATKIDFRKHIDDQGIHLHIGPEVTTCNSVFVQQAGKPSNEINPMTMDALGRQLLGGDGADITIIGKRQDKTDRNVANILLELEAKDIYPHHNALLATDFGDSDAADIRQWSVSGVAAGDNTVVLQVLPAGINPGAWFTLTDSVSQENNQLVGVAKNGTSYMLQFTKPFAMTYDLTQTVLIRTTASIQNVNSLAAGPADRRSAVVPTAGKFTGVNANVMTPAPLNITNANKTQAVCSSNIGITVDGLLCLLPMGGNA